MHLVFCNIISLVEIQTLCRQELDNRLYLTDITCILRAYTGVKSRTKPTIPISKEQKFTFQSYRCWIAILFGEICICNNLEKRGARPLHFRRLFSTFVGDILNYGSVTLFSCDERRNSKHNRENKWHCPPSYLHDTGAGLLLILSIGFPTTCRTKISQQPCAFFSFIRR